MAGFAEIPENPSEPPHFNPTQRCRKRCRRSLGICLASTSPTNVCRIAFESIVNSSPLCLLLEN